MKKNALSIILAGIWITASEFLRNELLFKQIWVEHYKSLGLQFETLPINGVIWMLWSFLFAALIAILLKKFTFKETLIIGWISGFILMWLTLFNLQVLPLILLAYAIPLSLLEVFIAEIIIQKIGK